ARVPGAVGLDMYTESTRSLWTDPAVAAGNGLQPPPPSPPTEHPSGWNAPAIGMLAIFLVALTALLWPQYRARVTEAKAKPLVSGLSGRDAGARCPRYITAIFTNVGSVSFDASGRISDHTDLTGPICDGLRRFYTPEGKAEMSCLVTDGRCSPGALQSIVALSVVAHESMHLAGEHDESQAECRSIAAGVKTAQLVGLTPDHGRMIAWAHYTAMNPNTPEQYSLTLQNCPSLADLENDPPGTEESRSAVTTSVEHTWLTLGDD
ncbi:MAG: hypothetical protein Q7T55_18660, partial [Solirubrobacteraceae bacterium]|nr:hypothetical protein [Solirubrobacteraceae bacterium]